MFNKILYLHGIGSTGNGNTVQMFKRAFPEASIVSPELPTIPVDAFTYIKRLTKEIDFDLVVGTSLGGFYAMMIAGIPKVLINPALFAAEDIPAAIGWGEHPYLNKRMDGETTYVVDNTYVHALKVLQDRYFNMWYDEEYVFETFGVFGTEDTVVSHKEDFGKYFGETHMVTDTFGHRMTEDVFNKTVIPFIHYVYDKTTQSATINFFE